jgi:hypothetical protein
MMMMMMLLLRHSIPFLWDPGAISNSEISSKLWLAK